MRAWVGTRCHVAPRDRRYQATIDLAKDGMILGGELIPFIADPHKERKDERRR